MESPTNSSCNTNILTTKNISEKIDKCDRSVQCQAVRRMEIDMARMRAIDAAVLVLEREGISCAFGVPGAAINPFYSALKARGTVRHILARHVEAASHMAEGYTRAKSGNIGLCIGTSGPAGTDMITGL